MSHSLQTFAQSYVYDTDYTTMSGGDSSSSPAAALFGLAFAVLMIAASWKIFEKAKKPGWASIVPIYSSLVWLQIINRPWWWLLLAFIPVVNFVVAIIIANDTAKAFGKGTGTTVLLILLPFIGYLMLGFGDAKYKMPKR